METEEELVELWMRNPVDRSAERLDGDGIAARSWQPRDNGWWTISPTQSNCTGPASVWSWSPSRGLELSTVLGFRTGLTIGEA